MFENLLLATAAKVADEAGKAVKTVGEKVNDLQNNTFEKYVEFNGKNKNDCQKVWMEESSVIKKVIASQTEFRKFFVFNMENELIYEALSGNIEKRVSLTVNDGAGNCRGKVWETGSFLNKLNAEYSISLDGYDTVKARIDYNTLIPSIELNCPDWKLCYFLGSVAKIVDSNNSVIAEIDKKIGKRRLISIYTNESRLCIVLIMVGILNNVRFLHYS